VREPGRVAAWRWTDLVGGGGRSGRWADEGGRSLR
jgi:hypothetical protein